MWPPSASFWRNEFPLATDQGVRPHLFKSLLPAGLCRDAPLLQSIADGSLATACREGAAKARVYIDESRREDLLSAVLTDQVIKGESLEQYLKRTTGEQRFGFVINNLERVSTELASKFGWFLDSMFTSRGMPIGGVEQVAFAGNYSSTAFGIHEGFEHAFLCHLGPGTKNFYCWSREEYLKLSGGKREPTFGDFADWLQYGELFVMEPGDILYLPAKVYHVGRQEEFSISIALPLYTYPLPRFFAKVVLPILSELVPFDNEGMSDLLTTNEVVVEEVRSILPRLVSEWEDRQVAQVLKDYLMKLRSNGGWEVINLPLDSGAVDQRMHAQVGDGAIFPSLPFKLQWDLVGEEPHQTLRVYYQGQSKDFAFSDELVSQLERLRDEEHASRTLSTVK